MSSARHGRLDQIDALRGLAALSVVLFHLSTRFVDLYHPAGKPWLLFPGGHYGVNLFFMISGFVIFLTLERTRIGMDFVISRFSRLFPAYWAAVLITWTVTHALGLPGREVDAATAVLNLPMFLGLFGVPPVDGAYWTLEVELLFYVGMYLLFRSGRLAQVHLWLMGLLVLRWCYFVALQAFGVDLPWRVYQLLIIKHVPWFALGVAIYALNARVHGTVPQRGAFLSLGLSLLTLAGIDGPWIAVMAAVFAAVLYGAARGRIAFLSLPPLIWLGAISYPLYLLHEYVSWSAMLFMLRHGVALNGAILIALAGSLALAWIVSVTVEQPAMRWIRQRWRARVAVRRAA